MPGTHEPSAGKARLLSPRVSTIACAALLAAFFFQSLSASLRKSPTFDEVIHITAGLSYVSTGHIVINQQHPPLLKELAGLFLRAAGVHWPSTPEARALASGDLSLGDSVGNALIADNGADRVLFWARLPLILLATGFGYALFLFARRLAGTGAALGAVFLYIFDPDILAHSFLVTTDMGAAGFILLALLALLAYLQRPSRILVVTCGLALGAALCAKFSAVVLLPVIGSLLSCAAFWPPQEASAAAKASLAAPDGRGARRSGSSGKGRKARQKPGDRADAAQSGPAALLGRYALAATGMALVAFAVVEIVYLFPSDPFQYITGMRLVNADHLSTVPAYLAGKLAPRFYSYYVVTYLLKEPLAAIVLAGLGLVLVLRQPRFSVLARAVMLLPPAALLAGYTVLSDNLGVRYILPMLLFAHLWGGIALASLIEKASGWTRAAAAVLCLWLVAAAAGIHPDHLSYFNEAACLLDKPSQIGLDGGSRCGPSWLDDSNVDWGQGLKQLKSWLDRNAPGQPIYLGYFGTFPPEAYGIRQQPMQQAEDLLEGTRPGLYAVSSHVVAFVPAAAKAVSATGAEWLRRTPPLDIVGHAYYIFRVPPPAMTPVR